MMFTNYSIAAAFMLATAVTATLDPATSNTNGSYPSAPSCSRALATLSHSELPTY